ncbi:MAG: hypothetical protein U0521_02015 [Anaerolineae bacterium]
MLLEACASARTLGEVGFEVIGVQIVAHLLDARLSCVRLLRCANWRLR